MKMYRKYREMIFFIVILTFISSCTQIHNPSSAECIKLIDDPDTCYEVGDLTCEQMCTKTIWSQEENKQFSGEHCSLRQCGLLKNQVSRAGGSTRDCIEQDKLCCCDVEYTNLKICPEEWIKDRGYVTYLNGDISTGEVARREYEYFMINGEEVRGLYVNTGWVEENCNIKPRIIECETSHCVTEEDCFGSCADSRITKLLTDYEVFDL